MSPHGASVVSERLFVAGGVRVVQHDAVPIRAAVVDVVVVVVRGGVGEWCRVVKKNWVP